MAKIKWKSKEEIELEEKVEKEKVDKIADYKIKLKDTKTKLEDKVDMLIELFLSQE